MKTGKDHIFSSVLKMWKCKAVFFPSLEKAIHSSHPKDLTLTSVRNLQSSSCGTDSPFQSSSEKLLPALEFTCSERIFHEVKVEIHATMCTFSTGSSTISLHCQFWKLQGVFSPLSYICVELITYSSKEILYCWLV